RPRVRYPADGVLRGRRNRPDRRPGVPPRPHRGGRPHPRPGPGRHAMTMEVEAFLSEYDEKVARMARALRAVVGTAAPDAEETVQEGWSTIGYRIEHHFMAIAPRPDCVRLR